MLMTIKSILKRNKITYYFISKIRYFQYHIIPVFMYMVSFNLKRYLRVTRLDKKSPYEKLRDLKNKHKGEHCFIVATGPSLTIEDLEKLKNEVTFSMNSICLAFDETNWRPTYYGIQGIYVYKQLKKQIEAINVEGKFFGDTLKIKKLNSNEYIYPLNLLNHGYSHKRYKSKFSNNAFSVVYDGYSITYSLIQLAVYMGFKTIYLLGADCNYSNNSTHHFKEYGYIDPTFATAGERMTSAYKEAKKFADHHNIKIYNATRGGMLEVFERVNLDDIILDPKKDIEDIYSHGTIQQKREVFK